MKVTGTMLTVRSPRVLFVKQLRALSFLQQLLHLHLLRTFLAQRMIKHGSECPAMMTFAMHSSLLMMALIIWD